MCVSCAEIHFHFSYRFRIIMHEKAVVLKEWEEKVERSWGNLVAGLSTILTMSYTHKCFI